MNTCIERLKKLPSGQKTNYWILHTRRRKMQLPYSLFRVLSEKLPYHRCLPIAYFRPKRNNDCRSTKRRLYFFLACIRFAAYKPSLSKEPDYTEKQIII